MSSIITNTQELPPIRERRVQFSETIYEFQIHNEFEDDDDVPTTEELWISGEEMRDNYRADVIAMLKTFARMEGVYDGDYDGDDEESDPICTRGLECYFPGEMNTRKHTRTMYSQTIVRKYRSYLKFVENDEERDERLGDLARAMSTNAARKAHAMALQDAIEARLILAEGLLEDKSLYDTENPFDFQLMRHQSQARLSATQARAA